MERVAKVEEAKALAALAETDSRELTEEEAGQFDAAMEAADGLAATIAQRERRDRVDTAMAQATAVRPRRTTPEGPADADLAPDASDARVVGERVMEDPTRGFRNLGDFANAVAQLTTMPGGTADTRLQTLAAASGMSQGIGADGGFAVPPTFATAIWDGMNTDANSLLAMTDNYPVEGESLTFVANAETSRATGSRFGGVRGYWLSEAAQITSSIPKVRQMKLEPKELAVLVYVTDKLLKNNTMALDQYVTRAAAEEINFLVGDSIINGTGAGQPKGVVTSSLVGITKETGQAADTFLLENAVKMLARLHVRSMASASWFINQDVLPQIWQMKSTVGVAGAPAFIAPGLLNQTPNGTLLGRPIVPIEYCQTVGTKGDVILADFSAYATGTKTGVEAATSIHLRFDYAETAFRFMFAVDGQSWLASALTPFKGSNTVAPFVLLNSRD